jgi:hypothetical protein
MYWFLLVFLIVLFLLGQRKEHMTQETHPIIGPASNPNLYDPSLKYPRGHSKKVPYTPADQIGPEIINKPPEDDGTFRSDTATQQFSIYFYKPFATLPFPTSPPPQPYLNDFAPFQR